MRTDNRTNSKKHPSIITQSKKSKTNKSTDQNPYKVIRRNGKLTAFSADKISIAMTKAFLEVEGKRSAASASIRDKVTHLTQTVVNALFRCAPKGGIVHIEDIQDHVELALMRSGEHKIARSYVLYRERRSQQRAKKEKEAHKNDKPVVLHITTTNGEQKPLDEKRLQTVIDEATTGLKNVDASRIMKGALRNLFDGIPEKEVGSALVMSARTLIDQDSDYSYVTARLLLDNMRTEALSFTYGHMRECTQHELGQCYSEYFSKYIKKAVELQHLDEELTRYDLKKLGAALQPENDLNFTYLGLQTLYDRYFIHHEHTRFELPQAFFMRIAMGLAINEIHREERAIEFYQLLSSFRFMSSTPTLFNSGGLRPQLSSCYLTTVPDDLAGIYDAIKDNALLSKFAGGLGNDWTPVRGLGSHIKGTNGKSQGVVPFLKVVNDTAVAVNQCHAPDTLLWTSKGPQYIKDIKVGDLVLGKEGYYRSVLKHLKYNQTEAMVEITVRHATHPLKITSGHPIWACQIKRDYHSPNDILNLLHKGEMKVSYCEAGKLKKRDFVAQTIPKEVIPINGLTEDDARLYGIMLGNGHVTNGSYEWGVSVNPKKDNFLEFIKNYLAEKDIHYWISQRNEHYLQIKWSSTTECLRDASTGRFIKSARLAFPFEKEDLYNDEKKKYISPRFLHLPEKQTRALIRGLLETEGSISGGQIINFTNTSRPLIEGLRYLLLRLEIPTAASYCERHHSHIGTRIAGITKAYDLRIPAVPDFTEYLDYTVAKKRSWFKWGGCLFTRVKEIKEITPVPFVFDLKVEGDPSYTTNAFANSNGGKRKGAVCAYLETWHIDIEEFLELRKNTGDERRRTHDMNTANWIPDLFMKRVAHEQDWTLFSPDETPDLHDLYGKAFEKRYIEYEAKAARGEMRLSRTVKAVDLWRKMLGMLFETGHPWVVFKEPCNIRYTNQHVGVVHSSNLCTEITLHTNAEEISVCNLGSVNLAAHTTKDGLDMPLLEKTITTATRMLDNVIEYNYYSVPQARRSNLQHRPVGLGLMGFQDALYKLNIPYASEAAVEFADRSMEAISYYAIQGSNKLAKERGKYSTYDGSLWSRGILPIDSLALLEEERGEFFQVDRSQTLNWDDLREQIKQHGMRNSNVMAIAPTACVSGDTLILSSEGLMPIASMVAGQAQWQNINIHIAQEGNVAHADQLYLNGLKETLRITTKRGSEITATPNHRIRVLNQDGDYVWKYFSELVVGDEVVRRLGGHQALLADKAPLDLTIPQRQHPHEKVIQLPEKLTTDVALILGLYMGDGYLKYSNRGHYIKKEGIGFAIHDDETALTEQLRNTFSTWGATLLADVSKTESACTTHLIYSSQWVKWFEANAFNKQRGNFGEGSASAFIPNKILASNSKVLCAFLSGLFIADGTVNNRCVEMATVSRTLATQVKMALESLGIVATLSTARAGTKGNRPVHRVRTSNIEATRLFLKHIGFAHSCKQQKLSDNLANYNSTSDAQRGHNIRSVAIMTDFIQAARATGMDQQLLNPLACSKTNGKMNIPMTKQLIADYPDLQTTKLATLLEKGNLYFEPIVSIEASEDVTYDLQVPKKHTYVANGFVSHNTISNICGVSQSIEPTYQNMYVKSNLSGEFTVVNPYLINELKALDLWDDVMINDLKYFDGSVQKIDRVPEDIKEKYATAFEIDSRWLIEAASRRQKWIDQGESLNLYLAEPSGKKLDDLYKLAWVRGLKTTYYLRTLGATHMEKSADASQADTNNAPKVCSILDPDCEACQ